MPLIAFYTDDFGIPLPEDHKFPIDKYQQTRYELLRRGTLSPEQLRHPRAASNKDLLRVHTTEYVNKVVNGQLSPKEIRRIGFPWSKQLVERSRRSVGATIDASLTALEHGVGVNLAGGSHHAFAHKGEGFCVFNDCMVAARYLQASTSILRIAIIDLDVHQGNGTANLSVNDPTIFCFSMHSQTNFPYHKEESDLDIPLADGVSDNEYLIELSRGLDKLESDFNPDFVFYLAGADPFVEDRFGTLGLSKGGLARRDDLVMQWCVKQSVPVAITMAGGYADKIEDIVDIHATTTKIAQSALYCNRPDPSQKRSRFPHAS